MEKHANRARSSAVLKLSDEQFGELFSGRLSDSVNLAEVGRRTVKILGEMRGVGVSKIGFACGIISSDGTEHIERNMARHAAYTSMLREKMPFPVFSGSDVFSHKSMFSRMKHSPQQEWYQMWRHVLESGNVTHLFFTPRWEKSGGAVDEHETATKLNLRIFYLKNGLNEPLALHSLKRG